MIINLLKQNSTAEEELLDYQLQRIHIDSNGQWQDDQILIEALHRFVIDKPTAGTRPLNDPVLSEHLEIYQALRRVNLLAELQEPVPAIRLSHDLLAPVVRHRYDTTLKAENQELKQEILRQIYANLPLLQFDEATANLKQAIDLRLRPNLLVPLAFELAFVYLHAQKVAGIEMLMETVNIFVRAGQATLPYRNQADFDNYDYQKLLEFLYRCDNGLFARLEQRYFPVMCYIQGGTFQMGDVLEDKEYDDEKIHTVNLNPFYAG